MNSLFINVNHHKHSTCVETIPLSAGYILAYLRSQGHGGVVIDDLQDRPLSLSALETWIRKLKPGIVGFSAYQSNMDRIRFLSYYVKSLHKGTHVLLGGPQAIFMPSRALTQLEDVDIICRGEGETVALAVAECLENNSSLGTVNGITFRDGEKIIDTPLSPDSLEDLDQFPSPYLNNIINLEGKDTAMIFTSRGCRYNCLFCISPSASRRKIRHHSAKRVLDEMEYLAQKGIKQLWIADSNFPASCERDWKILQGKIDRGIEMPFWCETRCDLVDEQMLKKLREAGALKISLSLEPGNREMLRNTGKGIALQRMRQMIEFAKSIGLNVELTSIFGLPRETFEKAYETLEFARACRVPIQSEQMRLYFGSAYQENHEKYGFELIPGYLPTYLSVGNRYETQTLTSTDIRKLRNISFLADESVRRDVSKFSMVDFLLSNEEDLRAEQSFYEYGAIVSSTLEEEELLWRFLNGYVTRLNPDRSHLTELLSKLNIFKETNRAASATSRIIFDCRIEIGGLPFPGMGTNYQDIVLGQSIFPPSCEMHFVGVREGQEKMFQFTFPQDYPLPELRDKTAKMWAKVHKVFNARKVASLDDLKLVKIRNHYPLLNLDRLSRENEVLYYLALRDIPEQNLVKIRAHFLMRIYHLAKLHRTGDIKRMTRLLDSDKRAVNAVADVLHQAGQYVEAARYYDEAYSNDTRTLVKKAQSLLMAGETDRALKTLTSMSDDSSLPFQEALLECLKVVQPDSKRILSLNRDVLRLNVEDSLDREIIEQSRPTASEPMVHGI
jgi:radical SAM superfamily enzyme YgiQ (UPF0313 family)